MTEANFIRRCHICGATTEDSAKVEVCSNCGKAIAPFFYFDEGRTATYSEALIRPPLLPGEYSPILGVSVLWKGG
ncbi:MAG: hypothetical protein VX583_01230 [Bdellovibrionota bacterium]|nr:hypothetical protein [Bdellovibrionota bacterium]|tara:strand:+ start:819 stop:1043 length:225 start_codon:yes stop_codon:yes gene_type:complete